MERIKAWKTLTPGIELPKSITLFPRIEQPQKEPSAAMDVSENTLSPELKPEINIDAFSATDLRVATVKTSEAIPRAKKLIKLEVDMGEPQLRTVVAGIADTYEPSTLVGKQVVIVANLKPAKLMGIRSQGMVLAASNNSGAIVLTLDKPMPPGTIVR